MDFSEAAKGAAKALAPTDTAAEIRLAVVYLSARRYDSAMDCKPADDAVVGSRVVWMNDDLGDTQPIPLTLVPKTPRFWLNGLFSWLMARVRRE